MRRPNRNIEVFDISLMAVVTKAMGAFLVLMLLLMPYYSSGPVGEKKAAELAKALAEAQEKLKAATASGLDPEELLRLLRETQALLDEAQKATAQLKRDNDALNSQVKRLEENVAEAEAESSRLQKRVNELSSVAVAGHMLNWDCLDVRLELGLVSKDTFLRLGDKEESNFLSYTSTLGHYRTLTDDEIVAEHSAQAANAPGRGWRFNQSRFRVAAAPGTYFVILVSRSKTMRKLGSRDVYPLKRPAKDCRVILTTDEYMPRQERFHDFLFQEVIFPKSEYAKIAYEIVIDAEGVRGSGVSPDALKWLQEQVQQAEKERDAPVSREPQVDTGPAPDRRRQPPSRERLEERLRQLENEKAGN